VIDGTANAVDAQRDTVQETLEDLGIGDTPVLCVVNKVDGMVLPDGSPVETESDLAVLDEANPLGMETETLYVSALTGLGVNALRARLLYEFFGSEVAEPTVGSAAV
jgi:50S ribosomal subunit-associated GTPase HflX